MGSSVCVVLELARRLQTAEQYLDLLDKALAAGTVWRDNYDAGFHDISVLHAYVLLHPSWFPVGVAQSAVQFARSFGPLDLGSADLCQAKLFWGVECGRRDSMEADHAFPYALGGPTDGRNMVLLCKMHNRLKAGDVHLYDWPQSVPAWVGDALARRAALL